MRERRTGRLQDGPHKVEMLKEWNVVHLAIAAEEKCNSVLCASYYLPACQNLDIFAVFLLCTINVLFCLHLQLTLYVLVLYGILSRQKSVITVQVSQLPCRRLHPLLRLATIRHLPVGAKRAVSHNSTAPFLPPH
jgi:hypothetical protein